MQLRTYQAATVQEAVKLVKRDLGSQAIILSTKAVEGLRDEKGSGTKGVEVVAALDYDYTPAVAYPPFSQMIKDRISPGKSVMAEKESLSLLQREIGELKETLQRSLRPLEEYNRDSLAREVKDLTWMARYFLKKAAPVGHCRFPKFLIYFYYQMLQQGIGEEIALLLIEGLQHNLSPDALGDKDRVRDCLISEMGKGLLFAGPLQMVPGTTKVAALVGPTGVGKTTTIAKLAALYAVGKKKKVALVTVDTYRIAAAEQLRTYARIMGLPFKSVSSPREFSHICSDFCDRDLILVDTAGRSPRDLSQLEELKDFLKQSFPVEVHLVMSMTHKDDTLSATADQFKVLPVDKIIFTKLDEAQTLGSIVNQLYQMRKPLSYVTAGQKVPEDIEVATREHIIPAALGERNAYYC